MWWELPPTSSSGEDFHFCSLQVSDKRRTLFKDRRNVESFQGVGQVLGGDTKQSRLVDSENPSVGTEEPPHDNVTSEIPGAVHNDTCLTSSIVDQHAIQHCVTHVRFFFFRSQIDG